MGQHIAAIGRSEIYRDSIIRIGLHPNLVMRRMPGSFLDAVVNGADEHTIGALLVRWLGARVGHGVFRPCKMARQVFTGPRFSSSTADGRQDDVTGLTLDR